MPMGGGQAKPSGQCLTLKDNCCSRPVVPNLFSLWPVVEEVSIQQCKNYSKGKVWDFSTWTEFSHHFVSYWLMGATIFETGPILSKSASGGSHETGCNVILWGNSNVHPLKVLVFTTDGLRVFVSDNIMERTIQRNEMFFCVFHLIPSVCYCV